MDKATDTTATKQDLDEAFSGLGDSAAGFSDRLRSLNDAIDELEASAARWSEHHRETSEALADAAATLKPPSVSESAVAHSGTSGQAPVADD